MDFLRKMINFERNLGTMVKKYYISDIDHPWLLFRGMLVYVEKEYDKRVNDYIRKHLSRLQEECREQGLTFLYIPDFYASLTPEMLRYYTGKVTPSHLDIRTCDLLKHILSDAELDQIQGPSLLLTGVYRNQVTAFPIGYNESFWSKFFVWEQENFIESSILQVLSEIGSVHGSSCVQMERQLFSELPEDERPKEPSDAEDLVRHEARFRVKEPSSHTGERWGNFMKKLGCLIVDEEVDEEDEKVFESDACLQARKFIAQLLEKGYSREVIWALLAPMKDLSPIHITRDFHIFLPSYQLVIELPPVQKAVYLLFLKHPEGICFKDMPDYEKELFAIYRKIAVRGVKEKHLATIADLVNPLGNSMNEKCSNIKKRVLALLDDDLAKHYYISGGKGELKKIDIRPDLVVWE